MNIYDIPTTPRLKVLKGFDLLDEFDDESAEDYRDFMSWFLQKDHALINQIPGGKQTGFFISEFEDSAFNSCDFQTDAPKFDRYTYRIRKVMERIDDLAMQHSCITTPEGRDNVRRMCQGVIESEFLIEALEAQQKGDKRSVEKANRLMEHVKKCAKVWEGWNPA